MIYVHVSTVEETRPVEEIVNDLQAEAYLYPARLLRVNDDGVPTEDKGGIQFQRCGGGRRVIRKHIGSN